MDTNRDLTSYIVCGRAVGRASGWDKSDTFALTLYDFEPEDGFSSPRGDVCFDFERGTIEFFDDEGVVTKSYDLVDTLSQFPIVPIKDDE